MVVNKRKKEAKKENPNVMKEYYLINIIKKQYTLYEHVFCPKDGESIIILKLYF